MPVVYVCTRLCYNLLMPVVWQGSVAPCPFDTCMRLLAQLTVQRVSVCINFCRLCLNVVCCVMYAKVWNCTKHQNGRSAVALICRHDEVSAPVSQMFT
jgi:hypothetical protein